jgi:hypothetical protein
VWSSWCEKTDVIGFEFRNKLQKHIFSFKVMLNNWSNLKDDHNFTTIRLKRTETKTIGLSLYLKKKSQRVGGPRGHRGDDIDDSWNCWIDRQAQTVNDGQNGTKKMNLGPKTLGKLELGNEFQNSEYFVLFLDNKTLDKSAVRFFLG